MLAKIKDIRITYLIIFQIFTPFYDLQCCGMGREITTSFYKSKKDHRISKSKYYLLQLSCMG